MTREEQFERMLADVQANYRGITEKMEALRTEGKTKTVTYRELLGSKLTYDLLLTMYRSYGLIE